jgi:hypothetical protein
MSEVKLRGLKRDTSLCISLRQSVRTVVLLSLLENMVAQLSRAISSDDDFAN